jgi:hypothetical protein
MLDWKQKKVTEEVWLAVRKGEAGRLHYLCNVPHTGILASDGSLAPRSWPGEKTAYSGRYTDWYCREVVAALKMEAITTCETLVTVH